MIHPTAIIEDRTNISEDVEIGPYTFIGKDVEIAAGNIVYNSVTIMGPTIIGKNNRIYPYASVGHDPQDKKFKGEKTQLIIGNDNIFRESVTVNRGTVSGSSVTTIGNGNLFMSCSHVAHDCIIGNDNVFVNGSSLAGHVTIGNNSTLGAFVGVQQYRKIGDFSFVGAYTKVVKDIPPFFMIDGKDKRIRKSTINKIGLKRSGFTDEEIQELVKLHKIFHTPELTEQESLKKIEMQIKMTDNIRYFLDFIRTSETGGPRELYMQNGQ